MKIVAAFLISACALCAAVPGQTRSVKNGKKVKETKAEKRFINPEGLAVSPAYTQVVTARGGKTVYISGQVPLDAKGELVGKGDLRAQTLKVFENLRIALAAAGANFSDVVKLSYFIKNYKPADRLLIRQIRDRFFPADKPLPASTLIGVDALFLDDVLIEVECVAVVD